jgi:hypothetical protein
MTDDQRFAARRPDVLVYETEILKDIWRYGDILAQLQVSTQRILTGFKSNWCFPSDEPETAEIAPYLKMSNYHMMVRSWCAVVLEIVF